VKIRQWTDNPVSGVNAKVKEMEADLGARASALVYIGHSERDF